MICIVITKFRKTVKKIFSVMNMKNAITPKNIPQIRHCKGGFSVESDKSKITPSFFRYLSV